jgi:4-hydroxy-tetrahydrodipicolinate reductase
MRLAGEAARALGDAADIEIVERHHHFKKDAPSGTALRLAEVVGRAIGSGRFTHGRHGDVGQRPRGEIGLHALRTGDNPGEHTVVFGLMGECLELSHRALNATGSPAGRSTRRSSSPGSRRGCTRWATCWDKRVSRQGAKGSQRREGRY